MKIGKEEARKIINAPTIVIENKVQCTDFSNLTSEDRKERIEMIFNKWESQEKL